ncbi:hypothetical protein IWZ01DRAFT_250029 [Phyllosticta capitalensis]
MGFASASRAFGACFNKLMLPAVLMAAIASPQTRLSDSLSSPCASSFQLWDCFTTVMASLFRHLLNTINSTALCAPLTLFHLSRISLPADPEERLRRSSRPHVSPSHRLETRCLKVLPLMNLCIPEQSLLSQVGIRASAPNTRRLHR